jgi:sentrin-specific protease 7
VIQKLIHEVVTGSLQNHPKLVCSNKQLDEKHRSRNAEEPAGDFPAQSSSVDQAELVFTIRDDGAQQSTSICLNDSEEKVVSASGGMVNTASVSVVAVQNLQEPGVCYYLNSPWS